ncbi:MAG TPA: hypothetical protein VJU61_00175 [Polyangiaceae bacterium]|jgi:hypothetical protein|nr:hypothetical protein [Polyangiaceae bacterium]
MTTSPYIYVAELCSLCGRSRFTWYRVLATLSGAERSAIDPVPDGKGTRLNREHAIMAMERFIATRTPRSHNLGIHATKNRPPTHRRTRPDGPSAPGTEGAPD